jgi:hypothetical protein
MTEQSSALSELRKLGLTIDIDEAKAACIWGELLVIAGRVRQGYYTDPGDHWFVHNMKNDLDAYHVIADEIVSPQTPDEIIEDLIPRMVHAFHTHQEWYPPAWPIESMKLRTLAGPIQEWKGKRFLMSAGKRGTQVASEFPKRAEWLKARLKERSWVKSEIGRRSGPDRKTVTKILNGETVRDDVLDRLARALSAKYRKVDITDIPSE